VQRLADMATTLRQDLQAGHAELGQLRAAQQASKRASKHSAAGASAVDVTDLTASVASLLQTIAMDRANLAAARHSDFTGISIARKTLASDQQAYHKSRHGKAG
jgi:hypothetical protein